MLRRTRDPDPLPGEWTRQGRQFAVMNAKGEYAAHTGPKATPWAGHKGGTYCTAQGNILAGEAVVNNMVERFETTSGHLSQRLVGEADDGSDLQPDSARDLPEGIVGAGC